VWRCRNKKQDFFQSTNLDSCAGGRADKTAYSRVYDAFLSQNGHYTLKTPKKWKLNANFNHPRGTAFEKHLKNAEIGSTKEG
jgi:hypothetical protein